MGVYFGKTEITNIDNLVPQAGQDITQAFFGSIEVFTVWGEYDSTLPATYSANGDYLADYRIYGASGGVGDKTDISNYADIDTGNTYNYDGSNFALPPEAEGASLLSWFFEPSIDYAASENVWRIRGNFRNGKYAYAFYPPSPSFSNTWEISSDNPLDSVTIRKRAITAGSIKVILTKNGAEPGYEVDMSVSDGTTSTTTPICVGYDPLGEDEYVSFKEQKVYRMSGGVLTPTEPPVPIPALPTVDGVNVVDYAGQSAAVPSRFVAKYRKEGY